MNRQLAIVKALNALYYCSNAVLLPYLPLYFAFKGYTAVEVGLLLMVGPFVAIVAQPVWGYVSDRFQTVKWVLLLLWSLQLLCSIGLFTVTGFPITLLFTTLLYFFLMPSSPLLDSLTIRSATDAGVSYGTVRMWGSIGFSIFAALSGAILVAIGGVDNLKWIYWGVWLFPMLLAALLKDVKASAPPITLRSLSTVVRSRPLLWFLLLVFVMMLPHRMNDGFLGLHMSDLGASEQMVGLAWSIAALSEVPTFALLHRYLHKVHELALIGVVGLLYVVRWIVYALATDPLLLLVMQASHSITYAVFWVSAVAYVVRIVPNEFRSTGQSILSAMFVGVTGLASGTLGGWIEGWGGYESAYMIGAVVAGIAGVAFLLTHAAQRGTLRRGSRGT
ncbi:MFS transporter [Paenibacillus antri]|uniref:MFS transporter n=1 Tax=Paenibacillus antri TaxID=2582848 RepID=A0A5R9GL34_9BACL|nr:MFS transporter [Paenibacillus antri]TLS54258.1 MFS transporter [Paenibacillus antri]